MKTILLVDDSSTNLAMLEQALEEEYKTVAVTSGLRALRYLDKNTPNLILLDIEMPMMNGFQTLKKIREKPKLTKVPVIFLTARKDEKAVVEGFKLGISDYIVKPFDRDEVKKRIRKVIGN